MSGSNIDNVISVRLTMHLTIIRVCNTRTFNTMFVRRFAVIEVLNDVDCEWETAKADLENYLKDEEFNGLKGEKSYDGRPKKTVSIERVLQRAFAQVIFSSRDPSKSWTC